MKYSWGKTVFPIAAIFSFRMLGLFLLIPVFTLAAQNLEGATPALIGLALGAYGLTQGLLQIPFGLLSDTWGRKPLITLGLLLFALGSLLGALTHSIYGMLLARIIQGTGAIGSVLIALLADVTQVEERTKAMAVIGMTIGCSFSLAMVLGPILTHYFGLSGIFYLTAALALLGLVLLHGVIPNINLGPALQKTGSTKTLLLSVLRDKDLLRLDLGIFCQHSLLTATFFAMPLILKGHIQQGHLTAQWHFYLPILLGSFLLMLPCILLAEKNNRMRQFFMLAILLTALCQAAMALYSMQWSVLCLFFSLYFVAFNFLEAVLPSLISKQAGLHNKGTAMGVYSTSQFLGIFFGGGGAGFWYDLGGFQAIFLANTGIALCWFLISTFQHNLSSIPGRK